MSACVFIYLAWLEMMTLNDHLERSNYYWTTFSASAFPCFDFVSFKSNKFHNILHCDGIFQLHFAGVSANVVGGKWQVRFPVAWQQQATDAPSESAHQKSAENQ